MKETLFDLCYFLHSCLLNRGAIYIIINYQTGLEAETLLNEMILLTLVLYY